MIKLLPFLITYNERQHWLINVLRELRDEGVHLESLRMSSSTHRTLQNYDDLKEAGMDPLEDVHFAGLPIVITTSYSFLQIYFSPTFLVPRMLYGSMDDAVPHHTILVSSQSSSRALADTSNDSTG